MRIQANIRLIYNPSGKATDQQDLEIDNNTEIVLHLYNKHIVARTSFSLHFTVPNSPHNAAIFDNPDLKLRTVEYYKDKKYPIIINGIPHIDTLHGYAVVTGWDERIELTWDEIGGYANITSNALLTSANVATTSTNPGVTLYKSKIGDAIAAAIAATGSQYDKGLASSINAVYSPHDDPIYIWSATPDKIASSSCTAKVTDFLATMDVVLGISLYKDSSGVVRYAGKADGEYTHFSDLNDPHEVVSTKGILGVASEYITAAKKPLKTVELETYTHKNEREYYGAWRFEHVVAICPGKGSSVEELFEEGIYNTYCREGRYEIIETGDRQQFLSVSFDYDKYKFNVVKSFSKYFLPGGIVRDGMVVSEGVVTHACYTSGWKQEITSKNIQKQENAIYDIIKTISATPTVQTVKSKKFNICTGFRITRTEEESIIGQVEPNVPAPGTPGIKSIKIVFLTGEFDYTDITIQTDEYYETYSWKEEFKHTPNNFYIGNAIKLYSNGDNTAPFPPDMTKYHPYTLDSYKTRTGKLRHFNPEEILARYNDSPALPDLKGKVPIGCQRICELSLCIHRDYVEVDAVTVQEVIG